MLIILAFHLLGIAFALRQDAPQCEGAVPMFSIIIATHDAERRLVATLCALVPGATMGVVREVIVADGGSHDETEQVADIAGCRFLSSAEPLGASLKAAVATARGEWLMFLRPGVVPGPSWIEDAAAFVRQPADQPRAAVFAREINGVASWLSRVLSSLPRPEEGLILPKTFYDELGGHRADAADAETDLLRRIRRNRIVTLQTTIKSDI